MELKDLIGEHELSGLDTDIKKLSWTNCNVFRFVLDGKTYEATEDPDDGLRSYLGNIEVSEMSVNYNFPSQKVIGQMKADEFCDVLQLLDAVTNEVVLEIGTDDFNDYYPCCVMNWYPEKLHINKEK